MRASPLCARTAGPLTALLVLVLLVPVASAGAREPSPRLGRSFVVSLVSGTVLVKPPGSARSARLTERRTIPVGSTVDATKGKVRLVGAVKRSGGRQAGIFYKGAFRATQARRTRAIIDLELVGGNFKGCEGAEGATAAGRRRLGRKLLGIARGRFRTRGNQAAATVRGTKWLTEDRCSRSVITAHSGEVVATNGTLRFTLESGDVLQVTCTPPDVPTADADVCLATLGDETSFAFALTTEVHQGDYTLCVQPPTGDPLCRVFPLPEPAPGKDYRLALGVCVPDRGAGTYTVSWAVQEQFLGTLSLPIDDPAAPGEGFCPLSNEELDQLRPPASPP